MNKKNNLKEALKKYSLMTGGLIGLTTVSNADIIYTNIDPDTTFNTDGGSFDLDLNNDGTVDFNINILTRSNTFNGTAFIFTNKISLLPATNNAVVGETSIAYRLDKGYLINSGNPWSNLDPIIYSVLSSSFGTPNRITKGEWGGAVDKYLGLSIVVGADTYYGWARLDVGSNAEFFTVKGYAFENIPNRRIGAGDIQTLVATDVLVADIANNGNGSDLQVGFNEPTNLDSVDNYRVLVVKASDVAGFDLDSAEAVAPDNYTVVDRQAPGNQQTVVLSDSATDIDGDTITVGVAYNVFVLTIADGVKTNIPKLSSPSQEITLTIPIVPVDSLTANDIDNNNNGSDIEISFTEEADTAVIEEFRVIVVKSSDTATFDLNEANAVVPENYTIIEKMGDTHTDTLPADAKDKDGDLITKNTPYSLYVLTVGNAGATGNALSDHVEIILTDSTARVTDLFVADTSNNGNGSDLFVSFDDPADTSTVGEYHIIVVKSENVETFTLDDANNLPADRYTVAPLTGDGFAGTLPADARDADGNFISTDVSYNVFILTQADSLDAFTNILTGPSDSITLSPILSTLPATNIVAADSSDNGDGSDLFVAFDDPADTSTVGEYQIIVVKSENAGSFNLNDANNLSADRYTIAPLTGNGFSGTLPTDAKDAEGDFIENDVAYNVFILTIADSMGVSGSALSDPSDTITLTFLPIATLPVTNIMVADTADNGNGTDLFISFNDPADTSTVGEYRIFVVKASDASDFDVEKANSLPPSVYKTVPLTGDGFEGVLDNTSVDSEGELIVNNVPYKVFVLTVADGDEATDNVLSNPSETITLTMEVGISLISSNEDLNIIVDDRNIIININNTDFNKLQARIYNISGQLLAEKSNVSTNVIRFSKNNLNEQIILISINIDGQSYSQKVFLK